MLGLATHASHLAAEGNEEGMLLHRLQPNGTDRWQNSVGRRAQTDGVEATQLHFSTSPGWWKGEWGHGTRWEGCI